MIVGKGFIANQLKEYKENKNIIIFASGVSNSNEINPEMFLKEQSMIKSFSKEESLFIYFSSCCVKDSIAKHSLYGQHKLNMEKEITNSFKNYLILRLPNILGISKNKNTFFNFFYDGIINEKELTIHPNSIRYFIDIADLNNIVKMFIELKIKNRIIDTAFQNPIKVIKCLEILEKSIGKKAVININKKYSTLKLSLDFFNNCYKKFYNKNINKHYTKMCFEKYVKIKMQI